MLNFLKIINRGRNLPYTAVASFSMAARLTLVSDYSTFSVSRISPSSSMIRSIWYRATPGRTLQ